jgi:hypothetical protein
MRACRFVDPKLTPMSNLHRDSPTHVAWLGYGRLLPFVGPAELPTWYLPLRWRLAVVASLCLLADARHGVSHG